MKPSPVPSKDALVVRQSARVPDRGPKFRVDPIDGVAVPMQHFGDRLLRRELLQHV